MFDIFVINSLNPKLKALFIFQNLGFFAEHVKSKVPIVRLGHFHTFCLRQMIEIFMVYSKDPKLKTLFHLSKSSFVAEIQGFKVTPKLSKKADFSSVDISGSIG